MVRKTMGKGQGRIRMAWPRALFRLFSKRLGNKKLFIACTSRNRVKPARVATQSRLHLSSIPADFPKVQPNTLFYTSFTSSQHHTPTLTHTHHSVRRGEKTNTVLDTGTTNLPSFSNSPPEYKKHCPTPLVTHSNLAHNEEVPLVDCGNALE